MRILIVGVDWLGDVLMSTPMFRAIKKVYPESYLAYSTSSRCIPAIEENPFLDHLIAYDERPFLLNIFENIQWLGKLRKMQYDTVLFQHRSATRAWLVSLSGSKRRMGYSYKKRDWLMTKTLVSQNQSQHRTHYYLDLLQLIDCRWEQDYPEFYFKKGEELSFQDDLRSKKSIVGKYAVLHPGGNWDLKRWSVRGYVDVAKALIDRGLSVVICGTSSEENLAEFIVRQVSHERIVSMAGKTSLRELACLLKGSHLMVTNDSGPMHLAAALQIPHILICGPTNPAYTGSLSKGSVAVVQNKIGCEIPCYFQSCLGHECMKSVSVAQVMASVDKLLKTIADK